MSDREKILLVGDNPFHGISHLTQERARKRAGNLSSVADKADVVLEATENGAAGFMFSVSDVTLSILKNIRERNEIDKVELYAIVPYAYEYVRIATQTGTPSLARKIAKQIMMSGDVGAFVSGIRPPAPAVPSQVNGLLVPSLGLNEMVLLKRHQ